MAYSEQRRTSISEGVKAWNALKSDEEKKAEAKKRLVSFSNRQVNYILDTPFDTLAHQTKRMRVILEQDGKCAHCFNSEWMGKPICFEMDHIDGNNKNNLRSNLEILCPNCHSNTPTWRGRKNAKDNSKINEYIAIKNSRP